MKLTVKLFREVKKMNRQNWHDETWWSFMKKPEVESINYALQSKDYLSDEKDIIKAAQNYLQVVKGHRSEKI